MRRLWIIGNSGAARECYWLFRDMLSADIRLEKSCEFAGFLGWRGYESNLKTLAELFRGEALDYMPGRADEFVIGVGDPQLRADIWLTMKERGAKFFTLVHPWSDITPSAIIGEANIFQRGSTVFCDAVIGNANYLNGAVNISHDARLGDANFLGPYTLVLGGCRIGSRNLLSVRSTLLPGARIGDDNIVTPGSFIYKGCGNRRRLTGNPAIPANRDTV